MKSACHEIRRYLELTGDDFCSTFAVKGKTTVKIRPPKFGSSRSGLKLGSSLLYLALRPVPRMG